MTKKLFIIDGHALCYRAYFAFARNPLFNSKGQNTSAIFGFTRMLMKLISDQHPDYLAVAFDPPVKSFRFQLYSEYKANRAKMPEDLRSQIEEIKLLVDKLGINRIEEGDFEADDVLGTLSTRFGGNECDVVLVTGDKDAYQLVRPGVTIYANKKGISEFELYDEQAVEEKLGIKPEQIVDYMAIVGDTADNIPGIKGIGEKGAQKLIVEYGSLDNIYSNLDKIKGKTNELLSTQKDMAYLCKELVTIKKDLPIAFELEKSVLPEFRCPAVKEYLLSMELGSVVKEIFGDSSDMSIVSNKCADEKNNFDWSLNMKGTYKTIRTLDELYEIAAKIQAKGECAVDTETTSIHAVDADIVGVSLSCEPGFGVYIPLVSSSLFQEDMLSLDEARPLLKGILEDERIRKIGQNIKYDLLVLRHAGITLKGIAFDTMIASYILNPGERRHNMDDMAEDLLNYKTITYSELVGTGKKAVPITEVPIDRLTEYAAEDADITYRLYLVLQKRIAASGMDRLYYDVELPLLNVLADMEDAGVAIDLGCFARLSAESNRRLQILESEIHQLAGETFNINSTKELSRILFDKLGLKSVKKTKTGLSTDITVLEALAGKHPIINALIDFRSLAKLKNTYLDTLPELISQRTGRIHTSYNQTVAATGRLSSTDPNLQNIPAGEQFGLNLRKGFVAKEGCVLLSADYSQIELRIAAHYSEDQNMQKAFRDGLDIHNMTASAVFKVPFEEITPDMRRQAKIINFATIYGVSPFGLSQQAEIGVREAAEFIRLYFENYPGFKEYMNRTIEFAREHGYVETLLGRRRTIADLDSSAVFRREGAERIAINTPIQGSSADMIKIAMLNIHRKIIEKGMKSRMIMQVHDELVFDVIVSEQAELEELVVNEMKNALPLSVPVVVDCGVGSNWSEAH